MTKIDIIVTKIVIIVNAQNYTKNWESEKSEFHEGNAPLALTICMVLSMLPELAVNPPIRGLGHIDQRMKRRQ